MRGLFQMRMHGEGGTGFARKRAMWPSPCNPYPWGAVARRFRPVRPMSLRDEDSLREAVTLHSPRPTAVPVKAATRLHAASGGIMLPCG